MSTRQTLAVLVYLLAVVIPIAMMALMFGPDVKVQADLWSHWVALSAAGVLAFCIGLVGNILVRGPSQSELVKELAKVAVLARR